MTGAGGAAGAAGAAAAAAAIANAIKASGVIVHLEPQEFDKLLREAVDPLVVTAVGGFFSTSYRYLFSYRGLAFYTKTATELALPERARTIPARKIWIPG